MSCLSKFNVHRCVLVLCVYTVYYFLYVLSWLMVMCLSVFTEKNVPKGDNKLSIYLLRCHHQRCTSALPPVLWGLCCVCPAVPMRRSPSDEDDLALGVEGKQLPLSCTCKGSLSGEGMLSRLRPTADGGGLRSVHTWLLGCPSPWKPWRTPPFGGILRKVVLGQLCVALCSLCSWCCVCMPVG